jgi:hypothetical protein
MIRDRKMYVVPTPFHLLEGTAHRRTLILPAEHEPGNDFSEVGAITRIEAVEFLIGYAFDLQTNTLTPSRIPNPGAGTTHRFRAWCLRGDPTEPICLRQLNPDDLAAEMDQQVDHE